MVFQKIWKQILITCYTQPSYRVEKACSGSVLHERQTLNFRDEDAQIEQISGIKTIKKWNKTVLKSFREQERFSLTVYIDYIVCRTHFKHILSQFLIKAAVTITNLLQ